MKAKWALLIPFMTIIIAIAANTTYATESHPTLEENRDFFIAKLTRLRAGKSIDERLLLLQGPRKRGDD